MTGGSGVRKSNRHLYAILTLSVCACFLAACERRQAESSQSAQSNSLLPAISYEANTAAGGAVPAAGTLQNPYAGNAAVAKNGAQLFMAMNCDGCHGEDAAGWVGPSLQDGRWRYGGADEEVFASIYYGRPKGMPAFGGTLGAAGIWTLVTYLKSLPVPANIATESWQDH
jgi:mono/diheme cytochrome c family protein